MARGRRQDLMLAMDATAQRSAESHSVEERPMDDMSECKKDNDKTSGEESTRKKPKLMEPPILENQRLRARTQFVPSNQPTLLRLPSGMLKMVTLERGNTVSIGKFGSFPADQIIGKPFGPTYEIKEDSTLEVMNQAVAEALGTCIRVRNLLQWKARQQTKTSMTTASRRRCRTKTSRR